MNKNCIDDAIQIFRNLKDTRRREFVEIVRHSEPQMLRESAKLDKYIGHCDFAIYTLLTEKENQERAANCFAYLTNIQQRVGFDEGKKYAKQYGG